MYNHLVETLGIKPAHSEGERFSCYKPNLVLGVMPTNRSTLPVLDAKKQKDAFMPVVRSIKPGVVTVVDIDDVIEHGIARQVSQADAVISKFKKHNIDALFIPFCDFGDESVVAAVASAFCVPVLIWGSRDEAVNTDEKRGRDTQCGMFAATKVLLRLGVKFTYIFNCETDNKEFSDGMERFIRAANALKDLKGLRIAKFGDRPQLFMSVIASDADLLQRFGVISVPISPETVSQVAEEILMAGKDDFISYYGDFSSRIDCGAALDENVRKIVAVKMAIKRLMKQHNCSVGAFVCGPTAHKPMGVPVCPALGEIADDGMPVSCETDINGAVTLALMRGCLMGDDIGFLADLTVRHPDNDNSELLWHCGPFPFSLKAEDSHARLINGMERWEMKQGDLTICRFDDIGGEYYLFAGEGKTTTGPQTTGTYVWFEADNWRDWEEKFMYGPYIHHVGCMYGKYLPVFKEVARYANLRFDTVDPICS